MPGSNHRVLFQNADNNINMGVIFNDPDLELDDIYWYMVLAEDMGASLKNGEGLITLDKKMNTKSCYVELHRDRAPSDIKNQIKSSIIFRTNNGNHPKNPDIKTPLVVSFSLGVVIHFSPLAAF